MFCPIVHTYNVIVGYHVLLSSSLHIHNMIDNQLLLCYNPVVFIVCLCSIVLLDYQKLADVCDV